jgi:hypothetical protein
MLTFSGISVGERQFPLRALCKGAFLAFVSASSSINYFTGSMCFSCPDAILKESLGLIALQSQIQCAIATESNTFRAAHPDYLQTQAE